MNEKVKDLLEGIGRDESDPAWLGKEIAKLTTSQQEEFKRENMARHDKELMVYAENKTGLAKLKIYAEMQEVQARFAKMLGDSDGRAYVESVIICVASNPNLQTCSPQSIMIAAMRAASLKLSVDPALHQAHLVPFKNDVTLILDYHGLVRLSVNTGVYEIAPNVFEVYEGEKIKLNRFSGAIAIEGEKTSDKTIGWCGYFKEKNGTERYLYMTNEECDAHGKKYNPGGYGSSRSAWNTDREKMRRKTVLRQLVSRWGNFSPQVQAIFNKSDEALNAEIVEMPSDADIIVPEQGKRAQADLIQELGYGE